VTDGVAKADLAVVRLGTPMPLFVCPSRGPAVLRPVTGALRVIAVPTTINRSPSAVVRGDYAACMGSGALPRNNYLSGGSPSTVAVGDLMTEVHWRTSFGPPPDGVIFRRSRIRLREISDGLSATYLLGEKYVNPSEVVTGSSADDNQSLFSGHDRDVLRVALEPPSQDRAGFDPTTASGVAGSPNKYPLPIAFGSAHSDGCGMAMADGSVRVVAYTIDAAVHRYAASRNDGQSVR
jgi:prepilin-type processing-associated H-X9-DG protein